MAATETVFTAAQTSTMCSDTTINPAFSETDGEYHITLQNRNGTLSMAQIYSALDTAFATVACNQQPARGTAVFVISA